MTKINNTRNRLTNCVSSMALLVVLTLSGNASADLLDNTLSSPFISLDNQGVTTYDATSKKFVVNASPLALEIDSFPAADFASGGSLVIDIAVDNTGGLSGGVSGPDLIVTGTVELPDMGAGVVVVSGVLLTGEVTGFGFFNSSGSTDRFDFTFNLTGGQLLDLYPSETVGIAIVSESSNFNDFTVNFRGEAKGDLGSIPGKPASLGDRVWEDLNADGIQDCDDTNNNGIIGDTGDTGVECDKGLFGVGVTLLKNCNSTQDFVAMASTDSNGFYQFPNLVPGEYCVKFDKTSADVALNCDTEIGGSSMFSASNQGGDGAIDSDADPVTGITSPTTLDPGETDLTIDAGLHCPAKLGDRVWNDWNRDGIQDTVEPGINGVTADLFACDVNGDPDLTGGPIKTRITDTMNGEDGIYMFNPLIPGSYAVRFSNLPTGFVFSPANQGTDDTIDSDADTATGFTACMPLESNQIDPTRDAGLNQPPAGLGDRLWEDKDADGLQKAGEPGIPGAIVNLLTPGADGQCDTGDEVFERMTTTVADGFYEFLNLNPDRYCVEFDISSVNICTLGDARFTTQNSGDEAKDSDANPMTGQTGNIDLAADQYDPTNDAGIVCPAKLGDRVWKDDNTDGIQDAGENGVNGVDAELYACDASDNPINGPIATTTTSVMGEDGIYMFTDLAPGNYAVRFKAPPNLVFTLPNEGNDDGVDSDADPVSGFTACMPLESNENNPTIDAGLIDPPDCGIGLVKTCEIITPPPPQLLECSQKVQSFTLIWNGSGPINISGVANDAPGGNVSPGDVVTFPGPYAQNNNFLTISGAVNGTSVFHTSCSDPAMDGETDNSSFPNDCGRAEGNGKDNGGSFINDWTLEGLSDGSGQVVNCTADPLPPTSSCEFSATTASCDTLQDKPTLFSFQYTGGGCAASDNSQGSKTDCSGVTDSSLPVSVTTSAGESFTVNLGETFTATKPGGSNIEIMLSNVGGTETLNVHTSCSAPLETGDVYGSLSLTALDGIGSGKDVLYSYLIKNLGSGVITDISVTDDKLGLVGPVGSVKDLNAGDSDTLFATGFISETTKNTATAKGVGVPGAQCMVSASATVTVLPPPPCSVSVSFKQLKDDKIKYEVRNTGNRVATLGVFMLDFPAAYGEIKEVKLDGAIYKAGDSSLVVGPGDTIGSGDWTESNVGKRELDPGEKRTLEIKFTEKSKDYGQSDFNGTVNFEEGCMVML